MSLNGICMVTFISTGLKFSRLERCWKKKQGNCKKNRVTPIDLKIIHKIFTSLKQFYPDNSNQRKYFLAACSLFFVSSDNPNCEILIKLRPYGGLIGFDNSSLDKYLKKSKILQLHAILHDAAGFIYDFCQQGPKYCYMLPWNYKNSLMQQLSGIAFCLFIKLKKPELIIY